MKNHKNIACADSVNVNIAFNLHSYEENKSFILETLIYDHIAVERALRAQYRTLLSNFFTKDHFFLNSKPESLTIFWSFKIRNATAISWYYSTNKKAVKESDLLSICRNILVFFALFHKKIFLKMVCYVMRKWVFSVGYTLQSVHQWFESFVKK